MDAQHIRTLPAGTLHPPRGSKNVWDNEHDPEGGDPAADPGHAGEVTSLGWFGNASVFLDELAEENSTSVRHSGKVRCLQTSVPLRFHSPSLTLHL